MVASFQDGHLFAHGALAQLALVVDSDFYAAGPKLRRHLIQHIKLVAREEVVLKIWLARLLAWMKCTDLSLVDYSSWTAFCKENSLWEGSHTRELIRFVESGLEHIINLVCHRVIPLTLALRAVKELPRGASEYDQMTWLADAVEQSVPKRDRSRMREITGKLMRIVETARAVAKVLIGWNAPAHQIDRFIIQCFEEGLTEEEIIARAKAVPGRPARLDQTPPQWAHEPKPMLIGGWREPRDQADCMAQMSSVRLYLEQRRMILGMAYVHMKDNELWRDNFYGRETLESFCRDSLEIDQRTLERYAKEGRELLFHPEAATAIATGRVTGDRAQFAISRTGAGGSLEPLLDLASRLDRAEMARAEELAEPVGAAYAPALEMAHQVESIIAGEPTGIGGALSQKLESIIAGEPTGIGGQEAALIAQHIQTESPTRNGAIRVGLRDATYRGWSQTPPFSMFVPPELIEPAKWFAEHVKLPKETGTREMVVHDRYCCQNPRCRKITIRVHSHHIWYREHLGPDDDWNLIALCPSCHLRGIHSWRMRLVRIGDWLVWTYGDGGVAIVHSPVGAHRAAA